MTLWKWGDVEQGNVCWVLLMPSVSYHRTRYAICSSHTSLLATGAECCFSYLGWCLVRLVSVPRLSVDLVASSIARLLRGGVCWMCGVLKCLHLIWVLSALPSWVTLWCEFCPCDLLLRFIYGKYMYKFILVHIYILFIIGLVSFFYGLEAFMKLMSTYKFRLWILPCSIPHSAFGPDTSDLSWCNKYSWFINLFVFLDVPRGHKRES